jgi:hypothetical protein
MAEKKESTVLKFARDAAIAIVGGIVLEPTLKQIHFDVGPSPANMARDTGVPDARL